ncbi:MAG: SusE domain-containing protein [Flammeovirgaceae bacterium]|nr:SusE domain-containing protein [Flammeovirgaceae bacterium]
MKMFQKFLWLLMMSFSILLITSCEDEKDPVISNANIKLPQLTSEATGKHYVFNMADSLKPFNIVFTWSAIDFGVKVPVKYTLQLDSAGRNFRRPLTLYTGPALKFETKTTDPLVKDFDSKLIGMGMPYNAKGKVEARVVAEVLSDAGNAIYPAKFSNVISFEVTPYLVLPKPVYQRMGFIGSCVPVTGWSEDVPMKNPSELRVREWVLVIDLIPGACKFRANGTWDKNWGGKDFPSGKAEEGGFGNDIPIPEAGKYRVEFNDETLMYRFTKLQ